MLKKFTCTALAVLILISGMICVSATSKADFSLENAKEYFTLMNGCSRTALKNYNDEDTVDAIVYCGLALSSPKIMFYLSMFYIANDIDTEKITADPAYCTQIIGNLNAYLEKKGIVNGKSDEFFSNYKNEISQNKLRFSTVGAYTFKAKKTVVQKMLDDGNTDFVIVGTGFMLKECDVNADGKINDNDVKTVQNLSADIIKTECSDEEKFVLYSADLDDNGKININDATALQQKMTA